MCEYWLYGCGHTYKFACKLPKLDSSNTNNQFCNKLAPVPEEYGTSVMQYDDAQTSTSSNRSMDPDKSCPGFPHQPKICETKCYSCVTQEESIHMKAMRPRVEALRYKRKGAGTDNWGYSSQGMVGFGENGNSSWLEQYDHTNGGFGTYLGGGRVMPDKREPRFRMAPQGPVPGMRVIPPGGPQSWPFGVGGTLSNLPSSAGGTNHSNPNSVHFGSSASIGFDRNNSDGSTGSSSLGSFQNPWAVARSDMGHVGVPGGRLPSSFWNGDFGLQFMPAPVPGAFALPPQPGSREAMMGEDGSGQPNRSFPRERYRSV